MSLVKVGENYTAGGFHIDKNRGIHRGSEWIVTCTADNCVSLSVYAGNRNGFGSITIAKTFFAQNFKKTGEGIMPDRSSAYGMKKHYHPEVNVKNEPLLPK